MQSLNLTKSHILSGHARGKDEILIDSSNDTLIAQPGTWTERKEIDFLAVLKCVWC
jgi:hypothetical protein